ncbi:BQ5605_C002g01577 [Microbotryum silenes-dioicae]|uniref:BQ5605_C002g01577 protein n=1 Tax=Microbotryum silenes-dioicae TaxID=796604 RepID=A0A2X0MTX3_9BASI|nr:BQ5605_C002g01577 [Microbotryum silenes-dioicae]
MSGKPTETHEHIEAAATPAQIAALQSYAVDDHNEQITVLGTMGQDPEHKSKIHWQSWAILALCALAQMQNTYVAIAPAANAYSIAGPLNGMSKRIWIVQAQSVPSIATGPIMAIISDTYGRRWVIIFAWVIFCISAILGMVAKNINQVIVAQTFAGVAAGVSGIMYAVASEVLPSNYRAYAQTVVNGVSSIASVIALIAMSQAVSADPLNGWRWIFRTSLIFDGLLLLGFGFLYFPPPRTADSSTFMEKVKKMDWIGYGLLLGGLVPLLMGFAWAGSGSYGWHDPHAYACVAVGFVGLIACILYEWLGTSRGFLDHRLFQNGYNFPLGLFLIAVEGSLFYLVNNIYAQQVFSLWVPTGGVDAGARLLPFFLVIFFVAPGMSYYVTKRKDLKWPLCIGFVFFGVCIIGLAESGLNVNMGTAFNAIGGVGFSAPLILLLTMVQYSTPPLFIGVASALTISVRTLGGTVGYAIADAIYGSLTSEQVPAAIAGAAIPLGFSPANLTPLIIAVLSGRGIAGVPGITPTIASAASLAAKQVEAHAYKIVWYAFLPGAILAAVGCALFRNPTERMNWVVDAPLKNMNVLDDEKSANNHPRDPTSSYVSGSKE